jgi:hypothetical protein
MDENTSLINIGELSKPATVLIEKISDAVGGIFKPYQIVRVAKAEAQAEHVRAQGQIEVSDLQRRAFNRFLNEEAQKQKNIEDITQKALPELRDDSRPADVEQDWLTNFFEKCRLISDEQMQTLWSQVLAGEANSPGTYSKRTLGFLSNLDKREAEIFTRLCGFMWTVGKDLFPIIFDEQGVVYLKEGINSSALIELQGAGLIQYELDGFSTSLPVDRLTLDYYGTRIVLKVRSEERGRVDIPTGRVIFTRVGRELAPISGSKPVEGFVDHVLRRWGHEPAFIVDLDPADWASLWNDVKG